LDLASTSRDGLPARDLGGLTARTSAAFDITAGAAIELVFAAQPSTMGAGDTVTPPVRVLARDAQGNTAIDFAGDVTVAIGTNPVGGSLIGTTTVAAVAGVATFSALSIDRVGTGYTLVVESAGLTGFTSAPFDVTPGAAAELEFTVSPVTTIAGATMVPHLQVTARDALGNGDRGRRGRNRRSARTRQVAPCRASPRSLRWQASPHSRPSASTPRGAATPFPRPRPA
jgi:hypothetical protein